MRVDGEVLVDSATDEGSDERVSKLTSNQSKRKVVRNFLQKRVDNPEADYAHLSTS